MSVDWPRLAERLKPHQNFILTSHIRPDCDALGSELGMAGILQQLGKKVRIINGHPTPPNLNFLDPAQTIEVVGDHVAASDVTGDALIILDTSAWAQLGPMADVVRRFQGPKFVIDHHVGEDELGAELFKDTGAEATGHLVTKFADSVGVKLTRPMATALFAAIATDTGWFRFASTTSETYRVAARLLDAGALPADIYGDLYERDTLGRVRLRGRILSRVQSEHNNALVHTYVLKEDFDQTGALPSDTEDAINLTLAIASTKLAFIMIEQLKGGFKVSFRSRCGVDCNQLARLFGGGGHKAAAGAFLDGQLDEVKEKVLSAASEALQRELAGQS